MLTEYSLPTSKDNEKQLDREPEPDNHSMFWQCGKCGACVLFLLDECFNCEGE